MSAIIFDEKRHRLALARKEAHYRRVARDVLEARFDANETPFLERQLTFLRAQVYDVLYAELIARQLLPIAADIPVSADTYVYAVRNRVGQARISANATGDVPRVDVNVTERTGKVRSITVGYGWDINTMREAARLNQDLTNQKALAAKETIDTAIDEMLAFGDLEISTGQSNVGCSGFINHPEVVALGIGNPASDPWSGATPDQIVADMNAQVDAIVIGSNQRIIPDTLIYAPREYAILAEKQRSAASDTTILKWFLENNPYIKQIKQWYRLTNAGAGGTTNRSICYRNNKMILEGVVPLEFEQLPPQAKGFEFEVPCQGRCGGVKIYQPLGVRYTDFS